MVKRSTIVAFVLALALASCGGSEAGDDRATAEQAGGGEVVSEQEVESVATPDGDVATASIEFEQRFGDGRAVLAASNGAQAVVATTVGIVARSAADAEFRLVSSANSGVRDLAISPDGAHVLVVTTEDGATLTTNDAAPMEVARLSGVTQGEFRRDGLLVAISGDAVSLVDPTDGTVLGEWTVAADRALGPVAVADDGRVLMSQVGGPTAEIVVWTGLDDPTIVPVDAGGAGVVARIVTAGDQWALGMRDTATAFEEYIAVSPIGSSGTGWRHDLAEGAGGDAWALTPDERLLVAAASEVVSVDETGIVATSSTTATPIERVTTGGLVVQSNGTVLRFEADGSLNEVAPGTTPVIGLQVEPSSGATAFVDTSGRVLTVSDGASIAIAVDDFVAAPVNDVAVAADGRIATASADGVVEVRSGDGTMVTELVHEEGLVDSVAFADDQNRIATGVAQRRAATAFDDTVAVWDPTTADRIFEIGGEAEDVAGCSFFTNRTEFSNDGSFVVSTSHDFTVSVIAVPSGELLHTFPPHANSVLDVAISPDDSTLVTSGDDSTMRVWDLESYELIENHQTTMGGYWSLSFLPDNESVVAGDLSGNMSVIDVASGTPTSTFAGSKLREARTAVSPDGRIVAAGAEGSILRLWSAQTGEIVGEASGHGGAVTSAAFSADAGSLVSSSKDGTTIVWKLG